MRKVRIPLTNFSFGEVSPSLISRTDTAVYNQSAQRVENFFLRAEGGLEKRAGLEHIYEFDTTVDTDKTQQTRLLPFVFSDDEQYIISLEHQKVRCFRITSSSVSLVSTITQDIDSNTLVFDHDDLHEYTFAQAGDTMFICHPTFIPQMIVRTGLTSFQVEKFLFDQRSDAKKIYQPYYSFQAAGVTLDPSATSGSGVTLTTSAAYWNTDSPSKHIGTTIRYNGQEIEITGVTSSTVATGEVQDELKVRLSPDSLRTNNGSNKIQVTLVAHGLSDGDSVTFAEAGAIGGLSVNNINGARTIDEIIDDDTFTITAGGNANSSDLGGGTPTITTHAPTTNWEEQSYSNLRGYPAAVTFHENRLVFAGSTSQPDAVWFSKTASYFNFDVGEAKDNEAIHLTASVGEVQQIKHLVSNRDLQIFAASSEMYVPAYQNQPITPTNAQIRRQTPFGCGSQRPQVSEGSTIFIQRGGKIAREFIFSDSEAAYVGNPISNLSNHLIKTPIEMTSLYGALQRPEDYTFILNSDGTIAVFNSDKAENRAGWVEFTCDGVFHSVTSVDDRVFAAVEFDVGGDSTKIVLCEFNEDMNLDMARDYTGTAGVFDVSGQFADDAVVHVIDGDNYLGTFTVASGNVDVSDVDATLTKAQIGYQFSVTLKTNPIDSAVGNGPLTGLPRGISSVFVDLVDTLSCSVNTTEMITRDVIDPAMSTFTGKKEFRLLGYNQNPQITISQTYPLNLQVNGVVAELIF